LLRPFTFVQGDKLRKYGKIRWEYGGNTVVKYGENTVTVTELNHFICLTPTLNPSPQGGGKCDSQNALAKMHCQIPLFLAGRGARGGGKSVREECKSGRVF